MADSVVSHAAVVGEHRIEIGSFALKGRNRNGANGDSSLVRRPG